MSEESEKMEKWLATKPPHVAALMREFNPSTAYQLGDGTILYVIGIGEGAVPGEEAVLLTPINPNEDYTAAVKAVFPVDPASLRKAIANRAN